VSASVIVHQFIPFGKDYNFFQSLAKHLQAYILIIALTSFIVYILQLPENYRSLYLLGLIQYSALSLILFTFIYLKKIPQKTDEIKLKFLQAYELKVPERIAAQKANGGKYKLKDIDQSGTDLHNKLELTFFRQFPEVFDFIERTIDLSTFNFNKTVVIRSSDPYNLLVLPKSSIQLFTNLHDLNDIRRLNKYFIDINERLITGGIFAGNFEPIRYRFRRFLHRYPFLVAHFLYLLDFIWHRMMPKLPLIRRVFFALSKGKNRALSLAEGLGRLYFCGFEVLDLKDIDNKVYFVARKVSEPLMDSNPSYSPIFKMRRNGKDGKSIFVYKLRTMHPYSEYLQEFVYEHNKLEEGGKFKDDFRITTWGRLFRRLWLDELPMLINWIKGDCKLVGIRPLSNQYLSLYDEDFKTRRFKYKPGLIPPYYADMPKNISEIIKSEEKYLDEYDKSGRLADFKYMLKALKNIVIHKQRSN
jgi:lipopolysaccharide/colanic/teichoic acid biosynthesis glycosyltransferase